MMTASLVMDPHPSVLHPGDTVGQAVKLVMEHRYRNLPVVDWAYSISMFCCALCYHPQWYWRKV